MNNVVAAEAVQGVGPADELDSPSVDPDFGLRQVRQFFINETRRVLASVGVHSVDEGYYDYFWSLLGLDQPTEEDGSVRISDEVDDIVQQLAGTWELDSTCEKTSRVVGQMRRLVRAAIKTRQDAYNCLRRYGALIPENGLKLRNVQPANIEKRLDRVMELDELI